MAKLSDALKAIIDNPEDLTTLPSLIAKVDELESQETTHLERIGRLQELNKQYLAQIPIPGNEPAQAEEAAPTMEDARDYLIKAITGGDF